MDQKAGYEYNHREHTGHFYEKVIKCQLALVNRRAQQRSLSDSNGIVND